MAYLWHGLFPLHVELQKAGFSEGQLIQSLLQTTACSALLVARQRTSHVARSEMPRTTIQEAEPGSNSTAIPVLYGKTGQRETVMPKYMDVRQG